MIPKFYFLTDLHITSRPLNSRAGDSIEDLFDKLYQVKSIAGDTPIIIGGDIFDRPYISIQVLMKFIDWLEGLNVYVVFGNHDLNKTSTTPREDSVLGLLVRTGLVKLVDELGPTIQAIHYDQEPWSSLDGSEADIFIVHKMLSSSRYETHDKDIIPHLFIKNNPGLYLLGHDHQPFKPLHLGASTVIRPGSFLRTSRDSYNLVRSEIYLIEVTNSDLSLNIDYIPIKCKHPNEIFKSKEISLLEGEFFVKFSKTIKKSNQDINIDIRSFIESKSPTTKVKNYLLRRLENANII